MWLQDIIGLATVRITNTIFTYSLYMNEEDHNILKPRQQFKTKLERPFLNVIILARN